MATAPGTSTLRHLVLPPRAIHYLRFLLEGYDGIALITTLDPGIGLIRLLIAPGCELEVEAILEGERERLAWRFVEASSDQGGKPSCQARVNSLSTGA
jgi:hypothetical protein